MKYFLKKLFKRTSKTELKGLLKDGATLIDVRFEHEYNEGHAANSQNIPLNILNGVTSGLDKNKTYVLVCASGVRSMMGVAIFKKQGFTDVYNGGRWENFK